MLQVSDIEMIFGFSQRLNSGTCEQAVFCPARRLPVVGQVRWLAQLRQVGINISVWGQEVGKLVATYCCKMKI